MNMFPFFGLEGSCIPKLPKRGIPAVLAVGCLAPAPTRGSTAWGRWLSEEPIAFAANDQNLRPYAGTPKQELP